MLSPEETVLWKKEAYRRRLAIEDFSRYRAFIHEDYQEWSYVTVINNLLKRVLAGETKRVIINMPPQHGKTMSVSEDFASYCMG